MIIWRRMAFAYLEIGDHSLSWDFAAIATHTPMTLEQRLSA